MYRHGPKDTFSLRSLRTSAFLGVYGRFLTQRALRYAENAEKYTSEMYLSGYAATPAFLLSSAALRR